MAGDDLDIAIRIRVDDTDASSAVADIGKKSAKQFQKGFDGKATGKKAADDTGDEIVKGVPKKSEESGKRSGSRFGSAFKGALTAVGVFKLGSAISKSLSSSIGAGLDRLKGVENATARLKGLGKSAEEAGAIVKQAQESVQGSIYTTAEASTVAAGAITAGIKPGEQLNKLLENVKNGAAATGQSMEDMGAKFNLVATGNKANNEVLQSISDQGLPIYQKLAEQFGVTTDAVRTMASEGKINFEAFSQAMSASTGNMAEEMGNTFEGAMTNFKGSFAIIGQNLLSGVFPALTPLVLAAREAMRPLGDISGEVGTRIGEALVPAIERLAGWLERTPEHMEALKRAFDGVNEKLSATVGWIRENHDWLGPLMVLVGSAAGVLWAYSTAVGVAGAAQRFYNDKIKKGAVFQGLFNTVLKANPMVRVVAIVLGVVAALGYFFTKTELGQKIVKAALEKIGQAFEWLKGVWDNVQPYLVAGWGAIKDAVGSVVDWFTSTAGPVLSGIWEGLKAAAEPVIEWVKTYIVPVLSSMWDGMIQAGTDLAAWYGQHVAPIFTALKELVIAVYAEGVKPFVENVSIGWGVIGKAISTVWTSYISPVLTWIGDGIKFLWKNVIGPAALGIAAVWLTIGSALLEVWKKYLSVVFTAISSGWSILWTGVKTVWTVFSTAFMTSFRVAWEVVKLIFSTVWEAIKSIVTTVLGQIKATIEFVLGVVKNVIKAITSVIRGDWDGFWAALRNIGDLALGFIRGSIERIFNGIMGFLSKTWGNIKSAADKSWNLISGGIIKVVEGIRSGVEETFSKMKDAVGRIWDGLKSLVASPINIVIGFVNDGIIGTYNKVAKALKLPELNVSIPKVKFQQGGYVDLPWSATDRDPYIGAIGGAPAFRFEGEEFITKRSSTRRMMRENPGVLEYINRHGTLPKYAGGGSVRPVRAGHSGWKGGKYRSGKWHGGLDFPAGTGTPIYAMWDGIVQVARAMNRSYGHHVKIDHGGGVQTLYAHMSRILTSVGKQVKAGQQIGRVGSTGNSTGPHLHLEVRRGGKQVDPTPYLSGAKLPKGGGIIGEAFGWVSEQLSKAKELGFSSVKGWFDSIGNKVGEFFAPVKNLAGGFGELAKGMGNLLKDGIKGWVTDKLNPFGEHEGTTSADLSKYRAPGGVARWENTVLQALKRVGQPASLLNTTLRRMNQESGGNPKAINRWDKNAKMGIPSKGLMQVIGPTFRAYRDKSLPNNIWHPLANIVASMRYALKRYGSLSKAYNKRGGYWTGTLSALPGWSLVGENGPEYIRLKGGEVIKSTPESRRMSQNYADQQGHKTQIIVNGVRGDMAEEVAQAVLQAQKKIDIRRRFAKAS